MSRTEPFEDPPTDPAVRSVEALERTKVMLQHPTSAIAVAQQGCIRETNAAWQALFRMPPDVSIESQVAALFANVYAASRFERALQAQLAARGKSSPAASTEHTLMRRDGTSFLAEIVVWLLDTADVDHPLAASAIWQVRDLTVERSLRSELRDLDDYYRELSRHQWDMTFVIDRKGRISYASPSIEGVLGFRVNALLGEDFKKLLEPTRAAAVAQWLRSASTQARREKPDEPRDETREAASGPRSTPADAQDGTADDPSASSDAYLLHALDVRGKEHVLACRPRNCFDVPRIAGMVVHARDVTSTIGGEQASAAAKALAERLRGELLALGATSEATAERRIEALLAATRATLDVATVSFVAHGDEARSFACPRDAVATPPLDAAVAALRVVVDARAVEGFPPHLRRALDEAQAVSLVEVPVQADASLLGRLVVVDGKPRDWSVAGIDFIIGIAHLIALALVRPASVGESDATLDELSGLPDRTSARRWLQQRIDNLPGSASLTMLSIDLDRLQDVNDRHGSAAGDEVIARTARTIEKVIGGGGYAARVGGDAFVIALTNASAKAVDETVAMLLDRIGTAPDADAAGSTAGAGRAEAPSVEVPRVEASIGVARLPGDAADLETLWLHADLAMREAKSRGRGQAFVFTQRLAEAVRVRKAMHVEISDALANNEFALYYQPQIALATGKVVGLEALLRWQHPTRGLLLPNAFIDAAVERGLIEAITKSVVGQVCAQIVAWRRGGELPELPVGVNVAGDQFHDRRLPALVASALMRAGLPARLLVLELNEQNLVSHDQETERVVKELSRLGVRTAVGGFALGHGAIKQLRQLRIAQIKLDRGFIDALPTDESTAIVVGSVIQIARGLKCQVIAEGIETREQFEQLRTLGCEAGQGFFFSPPLSPDETRTYVADNLRHPVR